MSSSGIGEASQNQADGDEGTNPFFTQCSDSAATRARRSDQQYQLWTAGAPRSVRPRFVTSDRGQIAQYGSGDAGIAQVGLLRLFVMLTDWLPKCLSWVLRPPGRSYGRAGPLTLRQRDRPSVLDFAENPPLLARLRRPSAGGHVCSGDCRAHYRLISKISGSQCATSRFAASSR
jgi:hypothetical protein